VGLRLSLTVTGAIALALAVAVTAGDARPRPRKPKPRPAWVAVSHPKPATPAVVAENELPGTPDWLGPAATDRAIEVYASATDAMPGDAVPLHVSVAGGAAYRVLVYRLGWYGGVGARQVACLPSCYGGEYGALRPMTTRDDMGVDWPTTDTLAVDPSWVSGYYLVRALLVSGPQIGRSATTYVVVESPQPTSRMLVQVPVNTWEVYNPWSGRSGYDLPGLSPRAHHISFNRPYRWDGPGGQGPLGWEIPFVRYVERSGYDVAYQSDAYTDQHPDSLLPHALVAVVGHSEYWTRTMRRAFESARDQGVNLAFMGANAVYWQMRYEDGGRTIVAYKSLYDPEPVRAQKTAMFREVGAPECSLIGIQFEGAAEYTWGIGDYAVPTAAAGDDWFANTGFAPGDTVRGIVSVEADTIPAGETAPSSCGHALTVLFHREQGGVFMGNADATRYTAPNGAIVFASGSLQFAWGLDDFSDQRGQTRPLVDPRLQAFMKNALDAMTR
jgi:hypothetical protein